MFPLRTLSRCGTVLASRVAYLSNSMICVVVSVHVYVAVLLLFARVSILASQQHLYERAKVQDTQVKISRDNLIAPSFYSKENRTESEDGRSFSGVKWRVTVYVYLCVCVCRA